MPDQDHIFAETEGDRWFDRNHLLLQAADWATDPCLKVIALYELKPQSVLEVGAANGYRLAAIAERLGARVVAVEPSARAIADGQTRFPRVAFLRATASHVPTAERFDLVILHAVLHWVDRHTLLQSVAEIDRLVGDGGFLLIGDFHPSNRLRVPYHHLPGQEVYTYKQDYASIFLASGLYHTVAVMTRGHASEGFSACVSEGNRFAVSLLRKDPKEHYVAAAAPQ